MEHFSTIPMEVWILVAVVAVVMIMAVPETIMLIAVLVMVLPYIAVFTAKYESTPTSDDCSHVVVTTFGGLMTNVDQILCGDEIITFGNKEVTTEDSQD